MPRTAHASMCAVSCLLCAVALASCTAPAPTRDAAQPTPTTRAADSTMVLLPPPPPLPAAIDLRPRLTAQGLPPRPQGARGTCSIFTTCEAIEFAVSVQRGRGTRLSPEYLNWAGAKAIGHPSDGNFFHNALKGFEQSGLCAEDLMPYHKAYDPKREPSPQAAADAAELREQSKGVIVIHWIVPWVPDRFGVNDQQFAEIKRVLAEGYPVAAGSGHSRLLVGYRDDAALPGGGEFITEDSALNRFDKVTYEFVQKQVADVFWVEPAGIGPDSLKSR